MRNPNSISIRVIGDKHSLTEPAGAVVEGLKRAGYNCIQNSKPRPSREDPSDALVYMEFIK